MERNKDEHIRETDTAEWFGNISDDCFGEKVDQIERRMLEMELPGTKKRMKTSGKIHRHSEDRHEDALWRRMMKCNGRE